MAIERDEVARLLAVEIDDGDVLTGVGFEASTDFAEGLRRTIDWYLANRAEAEAKAL